MVIAGRVKGEGNYTLSRDLRDLKCPHCHQRSENLKRFEVVEFCLFLLFIFEIEPARYTACPACMRKHIASTMMVNLLPANLLWPGYVLPRGLIQIVATYAGGVSRSIESENRMRSEKDE